METILQIRNLTKYFGNKKVVTDLNLDLYAGEVFGFLGPNGAGKTTTIKMVMSLLLSDNGTVLINNYDINKDYEKAMKNVGGIVENPETYLHLTGMQNLKQYANMRDGVTKERIKEVVALVGLENRINEKVKKYSLGMKQRLGLAQALLHNPKLLILDEPTNGLDPAGIKELRDIFKRLAHEEKVCVMVSSHLLSEMELMCDRVGIISNGELIDIKDITQFTAQKDDKGYNYSIKVVADIEKSIEILKDNNSLKTDENIFTVSVKNEDDISQIIEVLVSNKIKILEVALIKKNLEDIFMEVTESGGGKQID